MIQGCKCDASHIERGRERGSVSLSTCKSGDRCPFKIHGEKNLIAPAGVPLRSLEQPWFLTPSPSPIVSFCSVSRSQRYKVLLHIYRASTSQLLCPDFLVKGKYYVILPMMPARGIAKYKDSAKGRECAYWDRRM